MIKVERLLHFGADPNRKGDISPIMLAVMRRDIESLRLLLEHGAHPEAYYSNTSPLSLAVLNGQPDIAELLLKHGADPNVAPDIREPLIFSVLEDRPLLRLLLEHHANPNVQKLVPDKSKVTPLHTIARNANSFQRARMLLQYGADPNAKDAHGNTPLHAACESNDVNASDMALLLGYFGADPEIRNNAKKTPHLRRLNDGIAIEHMFLLAKTGDVKRLVDHIERRKGRTERDMVTQYIHLLIGFGRYRVAHDLLRRFTSTIRKDEAEEIVLHAHAINGVLIDSPHTLTTLMSDVLAMTFEGRSLMTHIHERITQEPEHLLAYPIEAPIFSSLLQQHTDHIRPYAAELKQAIPEQLATHKELLEISFPTQSLDDLMLQYMRSIQNEEATPVVVQHLIRTYPYQVGTYRFPSDIHPHSAHKNSMLHAVAYAPALAHLAPAVGRYVFQHINKGERVLNANGKEPSAIAASRNNSEFLSYIRRFRALRDFLDSKFEYAGFPRETIWRILQEAAYYERISPYAPHPSGAVL